MTEAVQIALITAAGSVLVALIGAGVLGGKLLGRVKVIQRQAHAIQSQVQNDHDSNLRDDLDGKHDENKRYAAASYNILVTVQRDVAWLMRRQAESDDRLDTIEDTLNPHKEHQ